MGTQCNKHADIYQKEIPPCPPNICCIILCDLAHERGCIASSRCKTIKPQRLQLHE